MNETKIGILGNGFVGNAIKLVFSSTYKLFVYDINPQLSFDSFEEVNNCDYVFVCVPTPMFKDGSQDLSNVLKVFENASQKPIYIIIPLAVGFGVGLMILMNVTHPPAGGNPIIVIMGSVSLDYLINPIIIGSLIILAFGVILNRLILKKKYPL